MTPESPDGQSVLFYTSTMPDGQTAGFPWCATGAPARNAPWSRASTAKTRTASPVSSGSPTGRRIVFHDLRDGEVVVVTVDPSTLEQRVLARHRMVSFGQQFSDLVPIYGVHFQPDQYRDVELLNATTGEIRTLVMADAIRAAYPEQVAALYGQKPISTPFGTLSPNLNLIFVKLSAPDDSYKPLPQGQLKWPHGYQSDREGLVVFDIQHSKLLFFQRDWGHPAWFPDSQRILNYNNTITDAHTGKTVSIPNLPVFHGQHLTPSPDGKLFVTDTQLEAFGGKKGEWVLRYATRQARTGRGSQSFREMRELPHGGRTIPIRPSVRMGNGFYYNVNAGPWTTLHVAERADA